jgi:peroxiredoxin Q/BCP
MPAKKKKTAAKPKKKKKKTAAKPKKKTAAKPKKKTAAKPKKSAAKAKPAKPGLPAPSTMALKVGDTAPAFSLPGDDGQTHTLAQHAGTPVVVYFYPRDDTPGCTTEACDFRDNLQRVTAHGAVVYGISRDSLAAHAKFKSKYNLNFTLLSDPSLATHVAYGAWGEKIMYGQKTVGVIRSTFLVGKDGKIAKVWPRVKVQGHVDDVLHALAAA